MEKVRFRRQVIDSEKLPGSVVEKWGAPVLREGFVPFPKKLVRSMARLFGGSDAIKELAAVLAVVDFKRPNLTRAPSLAYLAFLAGMEEDDLMAALKRLEVKGYVQLEGDPEEGMVISLDGLLKAVDGH